MWIGMCILKFLDCKNDLSEIEQLKLKKFLFSANPYASLKNTWVQ